MSTGTLPWVSLDADESLSWHEQPHLATVAPAVVVGVAVAVVAVVVPQIPWWAALLGVLPPAIQLWRVTAIEYAVTDRALYAKRGRRARRVTMVELDNVQDVSYRHSVFGGVFGYGTVEAEVAGGAEVTFAGVPEAQSASELVGRLVRRETDAIPGSIDQWQDVRDAVRAMRLALEAR
jgi:uncharacterized membrane protein YdbT with pleckstrin-like domain